ncbi:MAG: single-stranded DNA-binding protein [Planctomycetota bacterium]|jgi:single-strand DNA-binding protein
MANYNKVLLMGNLTRDPQLSYLPSQTAVVEFGLAVNRRWTGKDGDKRESTCFVDCQAFGRPAETLNKYVKRGNPLFVEGRLDFNTWTAQDGSKRSKHRVTVENFQFLGGSGGGEAAPNQAESGYAESDMSGGSGPGDDIPF